MARALAWELAPEQESEGPELVLEAVSELDLPPQPLLAPVAGPEAEELTVATNSKMGQGWVMART